ncbi:MAG: DUF2752 domain-containing protein [Acidobacteria bacterium]|nr:DUF2752 domain-containing protein [Acidobacteriota bacterium]
MEVSRDELGGRFPQERILAAFGLASVTIGSGLVWYFDPSKFNFFPVCPLYTYTGFACPGCGLTRGFHALFHGDILTALDLNALIPLWVIVFGFVVVSLFWVAVRGRSLVRLESTPKFLFGLLGLLIAFGVVRNLPFYPFTFLYP